MNNSELPAFAAMSDWSSQDGLSKREYFAGQALIGLSQGKKIGELKKGECTDVAEGALLIADALLAELAKPEQP